MEVGNSNRATDKPNIVIIGAASASFGPATLSSLAQTPALHGSKVILVDLNERALPVMEQLGRRLSDTWGAGLSLHATTDLHIALPSADFVIVATEVPPREFLWRQDWEIPRRHGLRQPYAENGGPGGMIHAFRQIPPILSIAKSMERLCPTALIINFSNPLPRVMRAITKYTRIGVVGKCHQIDFGYGLAAFLLSEELGYKIPPSINDHSTGESVLPLSELAQTGRRHFRITAVGLNHFTWIVDICQRETGSSLYPALRRAAARAPRDLEPLSMELFRLFGLCPVPGDSHLCEYLPWTHDQQAKPWQRYDLQLYDWAGGEAHRAELWQRIVSMSKDESALEMLRTLPSEGAAEIIAAITTNQPMLDEAVNLTNGSAIAGLAADTIVELPAVISASGFQPQPLPTLPDPILELLRREAALVELVVDAAVQGDRGLALQALLLDPMVNDIERAKSILQDYLKTNADYLPQFH
ncbi:MAG: hypothetical protein R3300_09085 [Candidatus Promineifilaceae bacterium]|nr:hypothetical protein [Candidatus Promineifilaceae bacterium]